MKKIEKNLRKMTDLIKIPTEKAHTGRMIVEINWNQGSISTVQEYAKK